PGSRAQVGLDAVQEKRLEVAEGGCIRSQIATRGDVDWAGRRRRLRVRARAGDRQVGVGEPDRAANLRLLGRAAGAGGPGIGVATVGDETELPADVEIGGAVLIAREDDALRRTAHLATGDLHRRLDVRAEVSGGLSRFEAV